MAQWRAVVDVPGTRRGPAAARAVVAAVLEGWGLQSVAADAELVVSELVTNAVLHAPGIDTYELELLRLANGVRLCLADGSPIRPTVFDVSSTSGSGRGMQIVQALGARWGTDEHRGGKRVWVDLEAAEAQLAET